MLHGNIQLAHLSAWGADLFACGELVYGLQPVSISVSD